MKFILLLTLFVFSGVSALTYEVTWVRMLTLTLGTTVSASSAVLAVFFGGLALGSVVFGRFADRIRKPLAAFAIMEACIGIYALAIPFLFTKLSAVYVVLSRAGDFGPTGRLLIGFALVFIVLLIPTTLMGGTYPVLLKATRPAGRQLGLRMALLYGANTTGGVVGVLAAGLYLLIKLGAKTTIWLAVAVNLAVAVLALFASLSSRDQEKVEKDDLEADVRPLMTSSSPRATSMVLLFACFVSGFCALACEVLWTRVLVFFLGYTVYSFTAMLATFLLGLAFGGWIISCFIRRIRKPLRFLVVLEIITSASILLSTWAFGQLPVVVQFLYASVPDVSFRVHMLVKFISAMLIMLPSTIAMGMTLPLFMESYVRVRHADHASRQHVAGDVGRYLGVNTLGGILGSIVVVLFLIDGLGVRGALAFVGAGHALIALALTVACLPARGVLRVSLAACSVVVMIVPFVVYARATPIIQIIKNDPYTRLLSYEEDATASISVMESDTTRTMLVNSTAMHLSYDILSQDPATDFVNAHLGMLLNPSAKRVFQIGFGAGMTLGTFALYPLDNIVSAELSPAVIRASRFFELPNRAVLADPRVEIVLNDGRNQLLVDPTRYDVIVNEAWFSMVTGQTPLTTVEFYRLVKSRLSSDGVYCSGPGVLGSYFKTELRTMLEVFEFIYLFGFPDTGCFFAVATVEPLTVDRDIMQAYFEEENIAGALRILQIRRPEDLLANFICGPAGLRRFVGGGAINTDDLPLSTYDVPSALGLDIYIPFDEHVPPLEMKELLRVAEAPDLLVPSVRSVPKLEDMRLRQASQLLVLRAAFSGEGEGAQRAIYEEAAKLNPDNGYAKLFMQELGISPMVLRDDRSLIPARYFEKDSDGELIPGAKALWANGSLEKVFQCESAGSWVLSVRARGDLCGEESPRLSVLVDGELLASISVSSSSYDSYRVSLSSITAGDHRLTLRFENDTNRDAPCDRNVYVKDVLFVRQGRDVSEE